MNACVVQVFLSSTTCLFVMLRVGIFLFCASGLRQLWANLLEQVPIVPYGGATSIEGHTLSPHGGVCIDMSQMKV